uniref:SAP30-binding protein isoform X2 n=1 Tax=Sus scrofa TaxID=9823 RepID=A0A480I1P4_PIG
MGRQTPRGVGHRPQSPTTPQQRLFHLERHAGGIGGARPSPDIFSSTSRRAPVTSPVKSWSGSCPRRRESVRATPSGSLRHCLAFFTMVPTAEMTVVLEPLALVVTVTTAGRVAVVVRMVGCAIVVTGMAESHLLFLFWASATAVLAVVVVVAVALVVVPFLVPVTNSILVRSFLAFSSLSISIFWALANAS